MRIRLILFVVAAGTFLSLQAGGARADDPAIPHLFVPATFRSASPLNDEAVDASRPITVRLDLLPGAGDGSLRVQLDLFGAAVTADLSKEPGAGVPSSTWKGNIEGIDGSFVSLTSEGDAVAGTISTPNAIYRLSPGAGGVQMLERLRPGGFAPDGPPVPVEPTAMPTSQSDASALAGGPIIDVLVVYTSAARVGAGGVAGINATIAEGIAETNTAYANSQVNQRVRLVQTAEVAYVESGAGQTDLDRLRDPADGYLDSVQGLRDQYGADLVVLVTETLVNPAECGRAYEMATPGASFATSAFAVVMRTCITGQYSLAHEMGHNMGASHDRANGCTGAYPYSCGYQDPVNHFRTIMAYDCTPPGSCPRILYFSNPSVTYLGFPTGVADSLLNAADNARTLNNTAAIVANFRPSIFGVALAFQAMPGVMTPGAGFAVQVAVLNSAGATVGADQSTVVTLSVVVGPATISCGGSTSRTVTNGVATFTNCVIGANGLYELIATANLPMTPATSAAIIVGAGYRVPLPLVASDTGVG